MVVLASLTLVLAACGSTGAPDDKAAPAGTAETTAPAPTLSESAGVSPQAAPVRRKALRAGERRVPLAMARDYTPSAPTGAGTDDYRCFLLDPKLTQDQFITGFNVLPGNPDVVHHVIMFRVPADVVPMAEQKDDATPGEGWTCFGNAGLGGRADLDNAPWIGAWAPGGKEQVYGNGFGERLDAGSRVVMQVHYNLLKGQAPDRSGAELRLAPVSTKIKALETRLIPAPVEMPCRAGHEDGPLCDRTAALADVKKRFGEGPGSIADLIHYLCGPIKAGPVQSCTQTITAPETIRGVAGHMHLLGKSVKIEVNPGTASAQTLLDIPVWDFDDQSSRPVRAVRLKPQDTVRVTCRHTQALRDRLPSFTGQPDKYVLWGEGTTDEMCLGILLVTRP